MTTNDNPFPSVALPPGAHTDRLGYDLDGAWEQNLQRPGYSRSLTWRSYDGPSGISVDIDGRQESDGSFSRQISLWGLEEGDGLTSASGPRSGPGCWSWPPTSWTALQ